MRSADPPDQRGPGHAPAPSRAHATEPGPSDFPPTEQPPFPRSTAVVRPAEDSTGARRASVWALRRPGQRVAAALVVAGLIAAGALLGLALAGGLQSAEPGPGMRLASPEEAAAATGSLLSPTGDPDIGQSEAPDPAAEHLLADGSQAEESLSAEQGRRRAWRTPPRSRFRRRPRRSIRRPRSPRSRWLRWQRPSAPRWCWCRSGPRSGPGSGSVWALASCGTPRTATS